jgi:hypothetical protein
VLEPAEVRIRVMSVRLGAAATFAIAVLYWLDGGGRSPIAYGLILARAFAAFQYPLRGAAAVAALVVGGYMPRLLRVRTCWRRSVSSPPR